MWSQGFWTFRTSCYFFQLYYFVPELLEREYMVVIASHLLYVAVDCVIFVFLFGWLNVKIINVLRNNGNLFASGIQNFGQFVNKFMKFVRFQIYRHFINFLNPLPNRFRMLIIELLGDKLLWVILLTLPFEFFIIESILASESGNTTGGWHSCTSDNQNLLVVEHRFDYVLVWKFFEPLVWVSMIVWDVRVGCRSHRSCKVFSKFVDDLVEIVLEFFNIFLVLLYLLQRLLNPQ